MAGKTKIEWTDKTWNPVRGCSRVSTGCTRCYAERLASRFSGPGKSYERLAEGGRWTGNVRLIESALMEPLRWRKPQRIFVNSMSDLFHEGLSYSEIAKVFGVMALATHHTFQVLTKRPKRMLDFFSRMDIATVMANAIAEGLRGRGKLVIKHHKDRLRGFQFPNVWSGVSVEDQKAADERIPLLLQTPAAVRFISAEPLLGELNLKMYLPLTEHGRGGPIRGKGGLDWVIVGGESGPGARPCYVAWVRSIVEQCKVAGVACFVKQLGAEPGFKLEDEERRGNTMPSFHHSSGGLFIKRLKDRKGGDWDEWPEDLRIREFPNA